MSKTFELLSILFVIDSFRIKAIRPLRLFINKQKKKGIVVCSKKKYSTKEKSNFVFSRINHLIYV